jgi:hypothetical protein
MAKRFCRNPRDETYATELRSIAVQHGITRPCNPFMVLSAVHSGVACGAESNQILFRIVARVATEFFVVNFQVRHRAACLASPAITAQNLLPHTLVGQGI